MKDPAHKPTEDYKFGTVLGALDEGARTQYVPLVTEVMQYFDDRSQSYRDIQVNKEDRVSLTRSRMIRIDPTGLTRTNKNFTPKHRPKLRTIMTGPTNYRAEFAHNAMKTQLGKLNEHTECNSSFQ